MLAYCLLICAVKAVTRLHCMRACVLLCLGVRARLLWFGADMRFAMLCPAHQWAWGCVALSALISWSGACHAKLLLLLHQSVFLPGCWELLPELSALCTTREPTAKPYTHITVAGRCVCRSTQLPDRVPLSAESCSSTYLRLLTVPVPVPSAGVQCTSHTSGTCDEGNNNCLHVPLPS